jgi:two-component system, sensor histidine kinase and response regulator
MDGMMLAQAIQRDPLIANTKLILLTSMGRQFSSETLREAGIATCLVKPVKQSELFNSMVDVLAKARSPVTVYRAQPSEARSESAPVASRAPRPLRVLVAEDNVVNQKVALRQLRKLGYHADAVANGLEVLAALDGIAYDVILMDCHMPELDGYQATRLIRDREGAQSPGPASQRVRIIAMTANAMEGDREKCLAAGMDDYVAKPVREEALRSALNRAEQVLGIPDRPVDAAAHVNLETLAEIRSLTEGGKSDPLVELIDLFLSDTPVYLQRLRAASEGRDAAGLHEAAHALKGSCGNLGATPMAELCRSLDQAATAGFLNSAGTLVEQIEAEFAAVKRVLKAERQVQLNGAAAGVAPSA